jgi:hypothetical protein
MAQQINWQSLRIACPILNVTFDVTNAKEIKSQSDLRAHVNIWPSEIKITGPLTTVRRTDDTSLTTKKGRWQIN